MPHEPSQAFSSDWNDAMYQKHPTPYSDGIAGTIQRARLAHVIRHASLTPQDKVLEVGCESGHLISSLPPVARLAGCDISPLALEDARALAKKRNKEIEFFELDALKKLPFQKGEFDVIICSEMLEHVPDPGRALANIHSICGPKTRVVLTVPIEAPKVRVKEFLDKIGLMSLLFPGIEKQQSEWHLQAFSKGKLLALTKPLFECRSVTTVWFCHVAGLFIPRPTSDA